MIDLDRREEDGNRQMGEERKIDQMRRKGRVEQKERRGLG